MAKLFERIGSIGIGIRVAVVGVLFLIVFWPILAGMYASWFDERANVPHGILVVPAVLCMAWAKRERLKLLPQRPSAWGFAVLGWGAAQAALGVTAHWEWVSRTAVLVSLVGCIAILFGWKIVRELAYPLATLVLMIAPPAFLFERVTFLQELASRMGESILEGLGYSVLREGIVLELVGVRLEPGTGVSSLLTILFICALYNYFFVESRNMRVLIFVMAAPLMVLGNVGRIVATGIASQYAPALITDPSHETLRYVSVALAAIGCMMLHIVMTYVQIAWKSRQA